MLRGLKQPWKLETPKHKKHHRRDIEPHSVYPDVPGVSMMPITVAMLSSGIKLDNLHGIRRRSKVWRGSTIVPLLNESFPAPPASETMPKAEGVLDALLQYSACDVSIMQDFKIERVLKWIQDIRCPS